MLLRLDDERIVSLNIAMTPVSPIDTPSTAVFGPPASVYAPLTNTT